MTYKQQLQQAINYSWRFVEIDYKKLTMVANKRSFQVEINTDGKYTVVASTYNTLKDLVEKYHRGLAGCKWEYDGIAISYKRLIELL